MDSPAIPERKPTAISRMMIATKHILIDLFHNGIQEIRKSPIQTLFVLGTIIALTLPILSNLLHRIVSNKILALLQITKEANLFLIMLSFVPLAWSFSLVMFGNKRTSITINNLTIAKDEVESEISTLVVENQKLSDHISGLTDTLNHVSGKLNDANDKIQRHNVEIDRLKQNHQDEIKSLTKNINKPVSRPRVDITVDQINILKLLYNRDNLSTDEIAASLNLQIQIAKLHLSELKSIKMRMIKQHWVAGEPDIRKSAVGTMTIPTQRQVWSIDPTGTKYLLDNKFVP